MCFNDLLYFWGKIGEKMNSSATAENAHSKVFKSHGNLANPHRKEKNKTASVSEPFLRPKMSLMELIKKYCYLCVSSAPSFQGQKEPQNEPQQTNLEDSKRLLRHLAAELDRVVQLRDVTIVSGVIDAKLDEEESQAIVLEFAELLQDKKNPEESCTNPETTETSADKSGDPASMKSDRKGQIEEANSILTEWTNQLKTMPKDSVCIHGEHRAVLQDLCKQWKNRQLANVVPVMYVIIRSTLQENQSEEVLLKQWFSSQQKHLNAGFLIPDSVWKEITRSSAKVTMDPNTANPSLMLSHEGRRLRTKTYKESDPWNMHQRKRPQYDSWPCIQATKGYLTGRHYWEVGVKGKRDWRVGVVKESASRKGFINMNTTAGYWTLRLQLGSLIATTDPITKLSQPTPSKIGVFLDLDEGHVSFCDAAKRRLIYVFKTDFKNSGKIYPVFGTVETDNPLKIL